MDQVFTPDKPFNPSKPLFIWAGYFPHLYWCYPELEQITLQRQNWSRLSFYLFPPLDVTQKALNHFFNPHDANYVAVLDQNDHIAALFVRLPKAYTHGGALHWCRRY